jgi:hypothetical protein
MTNDTEIKVSTNLLNLICNGGVERHRDHFISELKEINPKKKIETIEHIQRGVKSLIDRFYPGMINSDLILQEMSEEKMTLCYAGLSSHSLKLTHPEAGNVGPTLPERQPSCSLVGAHLLRREDSMDCVVGGASDIPVVKRMLHIAKHCGHYVLPVGISVPKDIHSLVSHEIEKAERSAAKAVCRSSATVPLHFGLPQVLMPNPQAESAEGQYISITPLPCAQLIGEISSRIKDWNDKKKDSATLGTIRSSRIFANAGTNLRNLTNVLKGGEQTVIFHALPPSRNVFSVTRWLIINNPSAWVRESAHMSLSAQSPFFDGSFRKKTKYWNKLRQKLISSGGALSIERDQQDKLVREFAKYFARIIGEYGLRINDFENNHATYRTHLGKLVDAIVIWLTGDTSAIPDQMKNYWREIVREVLHASN